MDNNAKVASVLEEVADLLELKEDTFFQVRAYRRVAKEISSLTEDIKDLYVRGHLDQVPGVGKAINDKIVEILRTGELQYLIDLRNEFPAGLLQVMQVPDVGPKTAGRLYKELKVTNLQDLKAAAEQHRIRTLKGFGERTEENILKGIRYLESRQGRMLLGYAYPRGRALEEHLRERGFELVSLGGSLRRMKETIGDIDILVGSSEAERAMETFVSFPQTAEVMLRGATKTSIRLQDGVQVDMRVVDPSSFGAALQYFTGSKEHNVKVRSLANDLGYKLNEYGVFRLSDGSKVAGETEEGVYELLGLQWMPPEMREDRGEVDLARKGQVPRVVTLSDICGDLHTHSEASDGVDSVEAMARAAEAHGYEYLAITDHSHSLTIGNGLSAERLLESMEHVRKVNEAHPDLHLLIGTEVEIDEKGGLDYPPKLLEDLDIVVAAVHSRFKMTPAEMTERLVTAVSNENVNILAHPTGRIIGEREGYSYDMDKVMQAAKDHGVAMEVNSFPERLDMNDVHCAMARERGVTISIDTDAHNVRQLDYILYGVATAKRGWVPPELVLNALPWDQLRKRLGL
ncbi:MAG TPA: DNA polymerase/3'-5' exonuclease PolX [Methanomassiliicoccales archaeon]|nr:DNA polymerase/3'-5' exonuclease PolX [Methanomassiliicoccales archaeon]HPR98197.1 DNA polymerase/3'-5' exonuclease PolX [Methanomassiliicoccales archaeon]